MSGNVTLRYVTRLSPRQFALRRYPGACDRWLGRVLGQQLVILGRNAVGKTTLHNYLRHNEVILGSYDDTRSSQSVPPNTARVVTKDHTAIVRLKRGRDFPGDPEWLPVWLKEAERARSVIYVFRADRLAADADHAAAIREDCGVIGNHCKGHLAAAVLVGTHSDLDPGYPGYGVPAYRGYRAAIVNHFEITKAKGLLAQAVPRGADVGVVVGSLQTPDAFDNLAFELMSKLAG